MLQIHVINYPEMVKAIGFYLQEENYEKFWRISHSWLMNKIRVQLLRSIGLQLQVKMIIMHGESRLVEKQQKLIEDKDML